MCGISGLIDWNKVSQEDGIRVEKSLAKMVYRGPDFSRIMQEDYSVLGHNRLSILDLNPRSNQPMKTMNGQFTIVFNGEIYNYKAIKQELESEGIVFFSTSDTEVLLNGYQKYGKDIVYKLRGMFSFVIWDNKNKKVFAARDRFGEKPFYYFLTKNKKFGFASNLSGIVPLFEMDLEINKQAVYELLNQQYISQTTCIYKGIQKMKPGSFMELTEDKITTTQYWSPNYKDKLEVSKEEIEKTIHNLIGESVSEQLEADVPVGLFLSGGTDSSIITALASRKKKDITAITMSTPDDKVNDEATAAAYVAKTLGVKHQIVSISPNCVNSLPQILKTIEPLADASLIPTMAVANAAHNDFKVMLSGDGGDELFGGYKVPLKYIENTFSGNNGTAYLLQKIIKNADTFPFDFIKSKLNTARVFKWGGIAAYYTSNEMPVKLAKSLLKSESEFSNESLSYLNQAEDFVSNEEDKLLFVGVKSKLVDDFLFKMDSANMFYSVESRAPFLDHRIIDYTSKLSINQLMENRIDKEILKNIGANYLSKDFFTLPKKGFSIPYYKYLQTSWGDLLTQLTNEGLSSDLNLINPAEVLNLIKVYKNKPTYKIGKILYSILVLEIWLRVFHLDQNPNDFIL